MSKVSGAVYLLFLLKSILLCIPVDAASYKFRLESTQTLAQGHDNADNLFIDLRPKLDVKLSNRWRAKVAAYLEYNDGDIGLGTRTTYSNFSKPVSIGTNTQLELDSATLAWRKRATRITFGKQSFAWGVLDGLQVTDRFDAIRRREAVFIDQRPDRIARWAARAQFKAYNLSWDAGIIVDGTADQLATSGTTYEPLASRFRGGIPAGVSTPALHVDLSDKPTFGVKVGKRFGNNDASFLMIHGPDTEPVLTASADGIHLNYFTRTIIGGTYQISEGNRIWRIEAASVFDQPVNVRSQSLATDDRQRYLTGIGMDWDLPDTWFVNAQLGVDHVEGSQLVRPSTDVIATIRLMRSLNNDTLLLNTELLGSVNQGDGTLRPSFSYIYSDSLRIKGGVDLVWGDQEGLFGQFDERDRIWMSLSWSL